MFFSVKSDASEQTNCFKGCEAMPAAARYLNTGANSGANCRATQAVCNIAVENAGREKNTVIVTDYDGSIVAEHLTVEMADEVVQNLHLNPSVFQSDIGSENSFAFGIVAPLLHALGYDTGVLVGGDTNADRANNLAARNLLCEKTDFSPDNTRVHDKLSLCIGDRTAGMTNEQVLTIHRIMYEVFPSVAAYLTTPISYQNFLAARGFETRYIQSGGTRWPAEVKAEINKQEATKVWGSEVCLQGVDPACPIISDTAELTEKGVFSITPNTKNVCLGSEYNENDSENCVDDGLGKAVGGMVTIEKREPGKKVVYINVNSGGDKYVAEKIWSDGGTITVNDNLSICESLAKQKSTGGVCVDVTNPRSETHPAIVVINNATLKSLRLAAEKYGLEK